MTHYKRPVQLDLFKDIPLVHIPSYRVDLIYFDYNGNMKYAASYFTHKDTLLAIHTELTDFFADEIRPGISDGEKGFHVLVDVPEFPGNKPRLLLNKA